MNVQCRINYAIIYSVSFRNLKNTDIHTTVQTGDFQFPSSLSVGITIYFQTHELNQLKVITKLLSCFSIEKNNQEIQTAGYKFIKVVC